MPSVETTAMFLHHQADFGQDIDDATFVLNNMIDAGSKYKQLEAALGSAVCLFLPTDIGETNWTKILTKSTERHRLVVQHLSLTAISTLATQYARLRERIVNTKLAELQSLQHVPLSEGVSRPSQNQLASLGFQDQGHWTNFNTDLSVGYETVDYMRFGS